MKRMRFTDRSVAALKATGVRYEVWSEAGDGYGIRVGATGRRTFFYMFRQNRRQHRLQIGVYGDGPGFITLAQANERLAQARRKIEAGEDPAIEAAAAKQAERTAETVADLVDMYQRIWAPRKRSAAEDARMLSKDVLPHWSGRKAKDIARRDVVALLDGIVARGSPVAANRTLALVRKLFNFGLSRGVVGLETNPATHVGKPAAERQKDRVLSDDELAQVWQKLPTAALVPLPQQESSAC